VVSGDLTTVDAGVSALYVAQRHTSAKPNDWDRFRVLFVPNALLVQTGSEHGYYVYDLDDYISEAEDLRSKHPLTEWLQVERVRDINRLGGIAHVFSTYDQRYLDGRRTTSTSGSTASISLWTTGATGTSLAGIGAQRCPATRIDPLDLMPDGRCPAGYPARQAGAGYRGSPVPCYKLRCLV
jgi:hypothetical protein